MVGSRILVVADDHQLSEEICAVLDHAGHIAHPASSCLEAGRRLSREFWAVMILDWMVPGAGPELILNARKCLELPVVVVSAQADLATKLQVLEAGADDMIALPFNADEMIARISAHLRRYARTGLPTRARWRVYNDLVLDLDTHSVTVGSRPVALTPREFHLLALLVESPHKLLSKAELYERVWGQPFLAGDAVTVQTHLSHLRTKLANVSGGANYLETVWSLGYRLRS